MKHAKDKYSTKAEAEKRAKALGGSGSHTHMMNGRRVFMPFKTHSMYLKRVSK
jgi:hypothetical protein